MAKRARINRIAIGAGATAPEVLSGTADPSAGGGVAANLNSMYFRTGTAQWWHKVGAGATAWVLSTSAQSFRYTVTGAEPDPSDFFIALPTTRPTDTYKLAGQLSGVTDLIPFDLPDVAAGDRTTTQFRIIGSTPFVAGDQIDFVISE